MRLPKEVAMWEERFERCKQARLTKEEQWYLNLAFYFGKQYAQWEKSGATNRLVEPAVPRSRVRLISNKIRPAIRREVTKLCKEEAQFYCVPNTTEQEDVMGAKVAESMADFVLDQSGFNKKRRSATWWASVTGTGFIKSYCATPNGPIIYENKTPFHIYVPYIQIEEMEDQPYVFDCQAVTAQKVYDQYGVELEPDSYADSSTLEQRFFNAMGIKTDSTTKDLVYVKEIWVKPCKDYPTGAMLVLAGKKIVHAYAGIPKEVDPEDTGVYIPSAEKLSVSDYPFEHNKFPFDKISHIPSGTFYGGSVIDDVIPLQKEYNRARSQITEAKNKTAKPQMAYQKGSIEPNKMTSEPGLLIAVNPGFEYPHYMIPGEYPSYAIMDQDRIVGDINEVTSQGEISRGTTPPGVEAASAIAYLQEQNDDILYWTIAQIEDAVASVGRKTLSLVQQFWDESKIVNIVSKNNSYETMIFKASDINGNVDLRVEAQSMAPRSRAAKQAFITGLMKDGLLPPEKGLRYLQMNETNRRRLVSFI